MRCGGNLTFRCLPYFCTADIFTTRAGHFPDPSASSLPHLGALCPGGKPVGSMPMCPHALFGLANGRHQREPGEWPARGVGLTALASFRHTAGGGLCLSARGLSSLVLSDGLSTQLFSPGPGTDFCGSSLSLPSGPGWYREVN